MTPAKAALRNAGHEEQPMTTPTVPSLLTLVCAAAVAGRSPTVMKALVAKGLVKQGPRALFREHAGIDRASLEEFMGRKITFEEFLAAEAKLEQTRREPDRRRYHDRNRNIGETRVTSERDGPSTARRNG